LFRGVHRTIAIDRSEGQITGCQEILYDQMMSASGGIPAEFNDLCQVIAPNPANTSHAILQLSRYGNVFLDSQFENGGDGNGYEYELIYYPTTTDANGYKLPQPDSVVGVNLTNLGDDKENYRWNFLQENNANHDDYSRIMALAKHFDKSGMAFDTGLDEVIDIDQWLRALAYSCASGAGDSFFANANHNGIFYARPDGRVLYFPHDMDFSYDATRNIFESTELQQLTADPARRRAYLGHLYDICTTVFNQSYMGPWTRHFGRLLPGEDFPGHLSYINARSNHILSSINSAVAPVTFAITTNGGSDFAVSTSPVTLVGQGWVNVRQIRLAGATVPLASTWTSANTWEVAIPLAAGPNAITLEALDSAGAVVGTDSIMVTNTGGIEQPTPGTLVVSEIYYNPPGSVETTEYVELLNTSTKTLDLSNVSFTAGITFTLPTTWLDPGARILVVKDQAAFIAAFGAGRPIAGTFPNSLDNSGEQIELRRADGQILHSFTYLDTPPWPVEADGDGYSLVLVAPMSNPDHADPRSWRASAVANGGTPGFADTEPYAAWKAANGDPGDTDDVDGDGFTTRQEYFLGGDPALADQDLAPLFLTEPGGTLLMSVTRRAGAEDAAVTVEISAELTEWVPDLTAAFLGTQRISGSPALDRLTFRLIPPPTAPTFFARFAFGP
ncbi:MAG: lamin tail domain-containing protein, partial [Akkermansiaceae bacterium]|nr:lamin tail domain-containing protein [Akkermansiaceae bacterium]